MCSEPAACETALAWELHGCISAGLCLYEYALLLKRNVCLSLGRLMPHQLLLHFSFSRVNQGVGI